MEHEDIGQAVVRLDAVKKYYMVGEFVVKAVDGVSLAIAQGEFTAIMGPSGSGKSTMMNLIGCLDVPTGGTIYIDGEATSGMDEEELAYLRNRKVGFVFQQFNLLGKLTALENVMTPLLYRGMPSGERKERAASALERVGLRDRMLHRPNELSGGQKQRVAITPRTGYWPFAVAGRRTDWSTGFLHRFADHGRVRESEQ
jgi:putative ABC transport system ATP-binding protein